MAKTRSNLAEILGRILKAVMVCVLVPLAGGLLAGILQQLDASSVWGVSVRRWVIWGFLGYVGVHLILYRPVALFRVNHRLFSSLAEWLFGSHVASVEQTGGGAKRQPPKKSKRSSQSERDSATADASTLVAVSPYVVPLYTVLVCVLGWALRQRWPWELVGVPVSLLLGITIAFHWVMTADDLQAQRERWTIETYLLAVGLIFVLTLLLTGACAAWTVPDFAFPQALTDGLAIARSTYTTLINRLFF